MRRGVLCRGPSRKSSMPMPGFIRSDSYSTVLVLTLLTYWQPIACLSYGNHPDFRLTPYLRSSPLVLCMYELHPCVSLFVLLSLPAFNRSPLSVHIALCWSLFFIGPTKPHTLLLLAYISVHYIPPYLSSCGHTDRPRTQNRRAYALERLANCTDRMVFEWIAPCCIFTCGFTVAKTFSFSKLMVPYL
jgi:hypothetical protein